MRYLFIFFIYTHFTNISFCQTKEETEDYIKIKLSEIGLTVLQKYPNSLPVVHVSYQVDFVENYMIIYRTRYDHSKTDNGSFLDSYEKKINDSLSGGVWIDLKEIKVIQFERFEFKNELIIGGGIYFIGGADKLFYYKFNGQSNFKDKWKSFYTKSEIMLPNGKERIFLPFLLYNSETLNKLNRAFTHLIKINGGRLIEDLF